MKRILLAAILVTVLIVATVFVLTDATPALGPYIARRSCTVCATNFDEFLIANPDFEFGRGVNIWVYGCEQEVYQEFLRVMPPWRCDESIQFAWQLTLEQRSTMEPYPGCECS